MTRTFEQREDGRVLQPRPKDSLQRRVDLGQQAVQPVRGQVVVEADDHLQLGDRLVLPSMGRSVWGIALAASAMMNASLASVFASPG